MREIERLRARVAELEDHQAERDRILGARVREIASQHDAHLDPYGFAEEMALEEFRVAVRGARVARRDASHGSRIALGMHASKLGAVRVLARIIRAIRAEREFALAVMRAMEESDD